MNHAALTFNKRELRLLSLALTSAHENEETFIDAQRNCYTGEMPNDPATRAMVRERRRWLKAWTALRARIKESLT